MNVALQLVVMLEPVCERLCIAGSLRRGRELVGDVELLYIPRLVERSAKVDMFTTETIEYNLADELLDSLRARGVLLKRLSKTGHPSWGEKNKLAVHAASGIPVDFFATTEDCWFNYLVCRTGPAKSNMAICNAAIAKGWKWTPYGAGFYRIGHVEPMTSERAVFDFVGLPYKEAQER